MTPVCADYSLMIVLIETEVKRMNLGIDRVIENIFFTSMYGFI